MINFMYIDQTVRNYSRQYKMESRKVTEGGYKDHMDIKITVFTLRTKGLPSPRRYVRPSNIMVLQSVISRLKWQEGPGTSIMEAGYSHTTGRAPLHCHQEAMGLPLQMS